MPLVRVGRGSMLIRYRFDTLEQLAQHLHVTPDATFLFVPEPGIAAARDSVRVTDRHQGLVTARRAP